MWRPKAENFFIALGLVLLQLAVPSLSFQVKLGLTQPLTKQHSNEALAKADPEEDILADASAPDQFREYHVPVPVQVAEEIPARPFQVTFFPYLSTFGNAPASGNATIAEAPTTSEVAVPAQNATAEMPAPPEVPLRLVIQSINLDAPVIPAKTKVVNVGRDKFRQWMVPNKFAVGWHKDSARLGEPGNTVFNGHHNVYGQVFVRLVDVRQGDIIQIESQDKTYLYVVSNRMILPETYETLDVRMNNAQWILPSEDERITLITCWPYESNTHRLIIVAKPYR